MSSNAVREELNAQFNSIRNANTEISFSWLLSQLSAIYPSNRAFLTKGGQAYVIGKMLEEGGEVHRAYSAFLLGEHDKSEIEIEVADLAAWVISCWDLEGVGKDLDAEFASEFARGCYRCRVLPCVCPTYSITRGQEELIRSIADQLRQLHEKGIGGAVVVDALASAEEVTAKPTPNAKLTLAQKGKAVLAVLRGIDQGGEAVSGIAKHLDDAIESLEHVI